MTALRRGVGIVPPSHSLGPLKSLVYVFSSVNQELNNTAWTAGKMESHTIRVVALAIAITIITPAAAEAKTTTRWHSQGPHRLHVRRRQLPAGGRWQLAVGTWHLAVGCQLIVANTQRQQLPSRGGLGLSQSADRWPSCRNPVLVFFL